MFVRRFEEKGFAGLERVAAVVLEPDGTFSVIQDFAESSKSAMVDVAGFARLIGRTLMQLMGEMPTRFRELLLELIAGDSWNLRREVKHKGSLRF
jgi:hypothetical protein